MPTAKGPQDYFEGGTWNIYCSVCGKKLKFSQAMRHWQGMWRCSECWEPRPMQDFATAIRVKEMAIPWPQKESSVDTIAPAFPASGTPVTNTFGSPITAFIYPQGADISDIKVNGVSIGRTATQAVVPPGQQIVFTYILAQDALPPMWMWVS
jgi:hypothetical protein